MSLLQQQLEAGNSSILDEHVGVDQHFINSKTNSFIHWSFPPFENLSTRLLYVLQQVGTNQRLARRLSTEPPPA